MALSFEDLKGDYTALWRQMQVRPERLADVDGIARRLLASKSRYQAVSATTGVHWAMIAVLHQRESSGKFAGILHNGEQIIGTGRRTTLVPRGRGPFSSWEQSAVDALTTAPHELQRVTDWSIERVCYEIERYNGFGYRRRFPDVKSPYLWSFSTNYACGKFVRDGVFDPSFVDGQSGTMPLLKRIMDLDTTVRFSGDGSGAFSHQVSILPPTVLGMGAVGDAVRQLQTALTAQGFVVGDIDGEFGPNTQSAVLAFQRARNLPATGIADQATLQALSSTVTRPTQTLQPHDVLLTLINALRGAAPSAGNTPSSPPSDQGADILRIVLGALAGRQIPTSGSPDPTPSGPILSPIDKMLGGETLAGKKTALAVVAYVVLAILKAVGVVSAASPGGQIVSILITAFGALGGVSKVDRVVQALAMIAAKRR